MGTGSIRREMNSYIGSRTCVTGESIVGGVVMSDRGLDMDSNLTS